MFSLTIFQKVKIFFKKFKEDKCWKNEGFHAFLRVSVFVLLAGCLVFFGYNSYDLMKSAEDTIYRDNFKATSQELSEKIVSLVNAVAQDGETLSQLQSIYYPSYADWPYVYINGFTSIVGTLKAAAPPFGGAYVLPFVYPDEVSDFETYMQDSYASDPNMPNHTAVRDFGFGIVATNTTTGEWYHDVTGEGGGGNHDFLTPIISYVDYYEEDHNLWNPYVEYDLVTKGVDGMYDCVNAGKTSCQVIMESDNSGPIPGALILTPIFPRNDPRSLVGVAITAFTWGLVLRESVASLAKDMYLVIWTNDNDKFTTRFKDGSATIEGPGDLHDRKYDGISHYDSFSLTDTEADVSVTYHMMLYPTEELYHKFHTDLPAKTTGISVLMIFSTIMVFVIYDRFIRKYSLMNRLLLQGKRQFVRVMSHEIRTPLSAALLGLQLLSERIEDELDNNFWDGAAKEYLEDLHENANDVYMNADVALEVLNDLLHYDKIEIGNLTLQVTVVNVWNLVLDNIDMFAAPVLQSRINLDVKDPFSDQTLSRMKKNLISSLYVRGDNVRLSQAIRNLISNALKFSKEGGSIRVSLEWKENGLPENGFLDLPAGHTSIGKPCYRRGSFLFTIKDEGVGMSQDELAKLFGDGVQFQPNKLQAGGGSGLGLFISKGIVELHCGRIWAESEGHEKGSTFFIELPLCCIDPGPVEQSFAFSSTQRVHPGGGEGHDIESGQCESFTNNENTGEVNESHMTGIELEKHGSFNSKSSSDERLSESSGNSVGYDMRRCRDYGKKRVFNFDYRRRNSQHKLYSPLHSGRLSKYSSASSVRSVNGEASDDLSICTFKRESDNSRSIKHSWSRASTFSESTTAAAVTNFVNILLVDDSASTLKLLDRLLTRRRFICDTARDGRECLDLLEGDNDYDVILIDYEMPRVRITYLINNNV